MGALVPIRGLPNLIDCSPNRLPTTARFPCSSRCRHPTDTFPQSSATISSSEQRGSRTTIPDTLSPSFTPTFHVYFYSIIVCRFRHPATASPVLYHSPHDIITMRVLVISPTKFHRSYTQKELNFGCRKSKGQHATERTRVIQKTALMVSFQIANGLLTFSLVKPRRTSAG